jgi:hypothetical protein
MGQKWSDNLGEKILFILGFIFVLFILAGLMTGGFGEVNTFEIDTVPP